MGCIPLHVSPLVTIVLVPGNLDRLTQYENQCVSAAGGDAARTGVTCATAPWSAAMLQKRMANCFNASKLEIWQEFFFDGVFRSPGTGPLRTQTA
jgi:hypothetical protein